MNDEVHIVLYLCKKKTLSDQTDKNGCEFTHILHVGAHYMIQIYLKVGKAHLRSMLNSREQSNNDIIYNRPTIASCIDIEISTVVCP